MCQKYGVQNLKLSSASDRPTLDTWAFPRGNVQEQKEVDESVGTTRHSEIS